MASGTYLPDSNIHYQDNDGKPLAGGTLEFFEAGTLTPLDTYNDPDLDPIHANPNPYTLNSSGWPDDPIFLAVASYKLRVKDANGVTLWVRGNIAAVSLTTTSLDVSVFSMGGDSTSPCAAAQLAYPAGATYDKLHAGSVIWPLDSANLIGDCVLAGMLMVVGVGSVQLALVNLTDGSPDIALVTISSSSTVGERQESAVISFPAGGASKNYGIKIKNTGGVLGFAWGVQIVRKAA